MTSASLAGRYQTRPRFDRVPRRPPVDLGSRRLPFAAIAVSCVGHACFALAFALMILWNGWHNSKVYVVNLVPVVAAVGRPTAPAQSSLPARPTPELPTRAPEPTSKRESTETPVREAPRLPEPAPHSPSLPPRSTFTRAGEKELPPLASPSTAQRPDKPLVVDRPRESQPAPPTSRGLPTGTPVGVGALSLDASDFPYAWYLRQVLQKVQGEWLRQNHLTEPGQKPLVFVEIQRDGSIRTPRIEQTSGNSLYDQAALRAIVDASPFPPLPRDWPKASLRVMFRFELERGRG
ncbi:MAG TPA: TonB family protein [Candidatus Methylomirabilis sp.]|nr:TonB family protein [Candidatus Methylomirabilis sp.]